MTIEADIYTALNSLVDQRCYPLVFPLTPPRPAWPAIRYSFVSSVPEPGLCGDTGYEAAAIRVQLDCVDTSFLDARALGGLVMAAMELFDPPAILENAASLYDAETKTFIETLDYVIHPSSPSV